MLFCYHQWLFSQTKSSRCQSATSFKTMRVFLDQLGCRLNFSENSSLAGRLSAAGHRIVGRPEDAHVIVLNTCAVTAQAARKSRQASRHLHKRNPNARIAITGCYATLAPQESAQLPGVQLVADNQARSAHTYWNPGARNSPIPTISPAFSRTEHPSRPHPLAKMEAVHAPLSRSRTAARTAAHSAS